MRLLGTDFLGKYYLRKQVKCGTRQVYNDRLFQEPGKESNTNIVGIRLDIRLLGTDFLGKYSLRNRCDAKFTQPGVPITLQGSNTNIICIRFGIILLGKYSWENKNIRRTACLHNQDQRAESPQQPNYGSTEGAHCSLVYQERRGHRGTLVPYFTTAAMAASDRLHML